MDGLTSAGTIVNAITTVKIRNIVFGVPYYPCVIRHVLEMGKADLRELIQHL